MRKSILLTILALAASVAAIAAQVGVIPQPAAWHTTKGVAQVPQVVTIAADARPMRDAASVAALQMAATGIDARVEKRGKAWVQIAASPKLGAEQYCLTVRPEGVTVEAGDAAGAFYALHTLRQLLLASGGGTVECCTIEDAPRFGYRGMMLDVSRYFIPMEEVKRIVDIASMLKINRLHLHLTDDNGWRMEIKRYPQLTKVGAWRVARDEIFPGRMNQREGEEATEGGFYTQRELRELVRYAGARCIDVIPEIEMPAHAIAAIASYPTLACPVVEKKVGVLPGIGGKDAAIVMCAGNEHTFQFIEGVLDEVMSVFPSQYIHIGGDEASKTHWDRCPQCRERIAAEGLADSEELQGYFMDRVNRYLQSKGRKAIGWDEVTYGNPREDIVVMGWQGMGGNAVSFAAKSGRRFVMTPARKLYLIRYQGPQWFEPFTYFGDNTLADVHGYEPVQAEWSKEVESLLWGVQASLWTEFCRTPEDVEYLLFPRLLAFADMAWRPKGSASWSDFERSLDAWLPVLDRMGVTCAASMWNLYHKAHEEKGTVRLTLSCLRDDVELHYTTDGTEPVATSPLYTDTLTIAQTSTVRAASFAHGKRKGEVLTLNFGVNKATGCRMTGNAATNGLEHVLTNGLRGSNRCSDSEWAGWHNQTAEMTVDLGKVQEISKITLGTLANSTLCVAAPAVVCAYTSTDGRNFALLRSVALDRETRFSREAQVIDVNFACESGTTARYVKFVALNSGSIPAGYAREGSPTWLYFDEIAIE